MSGEPPKELLELYAKEETVFMQEMYDCGKKHPELVRISPEIGGWQEVKILAQTGAERDACTFYHKTRTGENQFEKPIKMIAAKYAAEEEELSQTCEAAVLQEKMEQVRAQYLKSLDALQVLNIGKRNVQRKRLQDRLRKKKQGREAVKKNGHGTSTSSEHPRPGESVTRCAPPPPEGGNKLRSSKAIAALMQLEDEEDDDN